MFVKSRLVIAAAVIAGSASMAFAQNYQHDQTPDNTMSYGPRATTPAPAARSAAPATRSAAPRASAARAAAPAQAPASSSGPNYQHDQTPDNTMSYGPRGAR
jgi:hypothetical protein